MKLGQPFSINGLFLGLDQAKKVYVTLQVVPVSTAGSPGHTLAHLGNRNKLSSGICLWYSANFQP